MPHALLQLCRSLYRPWPMALLMALAGAFLLAFLGLGLALSQAQEAQREDLENRGERLLLRLEQILGQLRQGLAGLELQPLRHCDPALVENLRQVSFEHRFIHEASFAADGQLCSSRPRHAPAEPARPADFHSRGLDYWLTATHTADEDPAPLMVAQASFRVSSFRGHLLDALDPSDGLGVYLIPRGSTQALPILAATPPLTLLPGAADSAALQLLDGQPFYALPGGNPDYRLALLAPRAQLLERIREYWERLLPASLLLALLGGGATFWLVRRRLSLHGALQGALRRQELQVHYQPIFHLASRRCIGAEALMRWQRPDGSLTSPELFIPLAESTGQIRAITDFLLREVLEQLGDLLRNHPELYISINLSACDVSAPRIGPLTERLLARHGVRPEQIAFEVTERGLIDLQAASRNLAELRARGHRVLIDDFGTGYSSLAYLQALPVDCLKIDKAFVDALGADAASSGVAPHIVRMARALRLKVIAEGIEREDQARLLDNEGADYGQGWLFAGPLSAHAFRALIGGALPGAPAESFPPRRRQPAPGGSGTAGAAPAPRPRSEEPARAPGGWHPAPGRR
ncbi:EAL domain-containing protein [Azotobacter chroococcum]|uniref:cyclic-guanylate-specific phosphodiesterase n=1 Tax=Azotobacter chroococcum TaxID=353 RepID=A0AAP9YE83_9GAMM|nr:EAL domain-containing protein [Azotobacter chroococcum]QQE88975.1 EAL domain-containing protein [Azotobacter chroococcum]